MWEFIYNSEERLIEVKKNNTTVAKYAYNPLGQRTSKTLPEQNTTVHYLYNQEGMVGEYDDTGQLIQEYSWKPNSVWMTDPLFTRTVDSASGKTQVHYYINDHLGTPQKAFRRNGKVTWKAQASAFGETVVWDGSELRNNLRFPGQYFDAETGLHYNYFRDYAPGLGRYVESDPIGLLGGVNTYLYSFANPIILFDIFGLKSNCRSWECAAMPKQYNCAFVQDCIKDFKELQKGPDPKTPLDDALKRGKDMRNNMNTPARTAAKKKILDIAVDYGIGTLCSQLNYQACAGDHDKAWSPYDEILLEAPLSCPIEVKK